MELKGFVRMELDNLKRGLERATKDLTQNEIVWRPSCGCNSIGLLLFHVAKSEDSFIQGRLQGKPEIWESEKWYQKLNMPASESGAHYTADQVNAFPVPQLKDVLAYSEAVREKTVAYLNSLSAESFDKKFSMPPFGDVTTAGIFALIVTHTAQHIGEISYLRGLQRGMDK